MWHPGTFTGQPWNCTEASKLSQFLNNQRPSKTHPKEQAGKETSTQSVARSDWWGMKTVCTTMWMNGCGNTHCMQGSMPFPTVYRNWSDFSEWLTTFPAGVWLHAFRVHCYRYCPTFIQYPCSHCYQFLLTCRYLQQLHVPNKLDNF